MSSTLVLFIYGLAFFSLGLAMWFESGRSPVLVERRVLIPLAIFGLVHGLHEWLEMFLATSEWIPPPIPVQFEWLRLTVLFISFIALAAFSLQILFPHSNSSKNEVLLFLAALIGYAAFVFLAGYMIWNYHGDLTAHIDVSARYFLAVPGSLIAGVALLREANRPKEMGVLRVSAAMQLSAIGFLIYGLTQLIVPAADTFPTNVVNAASFHSVVGFPIQVVRTVMAVMIAFGLMRATRISERERQRQMFALQQESLSVALQLERELNERAAMQEDKMRHIVQAQEEERSRIAHELHDETAQILTAFTFHLAAARHLLGQPDQLIAQLDQLRILSRQMAAGIHRLVHDLRPAQLDSLGLVASLQHLSEKAEERMGLRVNLEVQGERQRLDPVIETTIFRIAQEALTNTARHAGVSEAQMNLTFNDERVSLVVIDSGCGFEMDRIGNEALGLAGMKERVTTLEGDFNIESAPGKGTKVGITIPIWV